MDDQNNDQPSTQYYLEEILEVLKEMRLMMEHGFRAIEVHGDSVDKNMGDIENLLKYIQRDLEKR